MTGGSSLVASNLGDRGLELREHRKVLDVLGEQICTVDFCGGGNHVVHGGNPLVAASKCSCPLTGSCGDLDGSVDVGQ